MKYTNMIVDEVRRPKCTDKDWKGVAVSFGDNICFALILFTKGRMHLIQQIDSRHWELVNPS